MALTPGMELLVCSSAWLRFVLVAGSLVLATISGASAPASSSLLWNFDANAPDTLPSNFEVGTLFDGKSAGEWKVVQTDKAKSLPNVLAQLLGKGAEHAYKVVLIKGTDATNLDLSVSFLAIKGKADMGGGLIWRAADDRNYYLVRANPLEQNVRLYRVLNGVRHMLKNYDTIIDVRKWHTLQVVVRGCHVAVIFDGNSTLEHCDETFERGRIGLWTKSDAVTYFDDLRLEIER